MELNKIIKESKRGTSRTKQEIDRDKEREKGTKKERERDSVYVFVCMRGGRGWGKEDNIR